MHGVAALFVNQDDTRAIANTILILPHAAAATTALNTTVSSIGKAVTGGMKHPRFHAHLVTCDRCAFRRGVERSTRPRLPRVGGAGAGA